MHQPNGKTEVHRKGFLFFGGAVPMPQPGSTVLVPTKEVKPYRDNTSLLVALASVIASTATIIISLLRP